MTIEQMAAQLIELVRADIEHDQSTVTEVPMTQQERGIIGINLRDALQRVSSKYKGCTVWVEADGRCATIANLHDHPPVHTTIEKIRARISQGRHQ